MITIKLLFLCGFALSSVFVIVLLWPFRAMLRVIAVFLFSLLLMVITAVLKRSTKERDLVPKEEKEEYRKLRFTLTELSFASQRRCAVVLDIAIWSSEFRCALIKNNQWKEHKNITKETSFLSGDDGPGVPMSDFTLRCERRCSRLPF